MPTFAPQLGDIDGDGHMDIITGSNCCAPNQIHWFSGATDGAFLARRSAKMTFDSAKRPRFDKSEGRPYLVDWNRDGHDDVVVLMEELGEQSSEVVYRLYVNTQHDRGLAPLPDEVESTPAKEPEWRFRRFDMGPNDPLEREDRTLRKHEQKAVIHFAFGDYDNDGHFDALFCETVYEVELILDEVEGSYRRYNKKRSSIQFMKNLKATGEPKFAPPRKIFEPGQDWGTTSIALADLDHDGQLEVVSSVTRPNRENPRELDAELWLLEPKITSGNSN